MKKGMYILLLAVTVYLNLLYEWRSGIAVLMAEVVFLLFCLVMAVLGIRGITGHITMDKIMLEQKEMCNVKMSLKNRMTFPVPVKVQFCYRYVADEKEKKTVYRVYMNGREEQHLMCEITPEYCGKIEIQIKKMVCYDVLGIWAIAKRSKEKLLATMMPKTYPVSLIVSSRTKWFPVDGESYAQDRSGEDSAEIYDVREYQAGDRMQKVHWKLSAREDALYIKEFSYPLGAAVVLLLEEDAQRNGVGNLFMEAVVSISTALLERECVHYIVWKKKDENGITRVLVRTEEDLYECIMEVLEFSKNCLEQNAEEQYRYTYKNDTYAGMVKIDTGMQLQINGKEKMNMLQDGLETFFHTVEIVV